MLEALIDRLPHRARQRKTPEQRAEALRRAIEGLPVHTRRAMVIGIDSNRIIVGAYVDDRGGICPMLAAHRSGGRTCFAAFARAWDDFTYAGRRPTPATDDQVGALRAMLVSRLPRNDEARRAAEAPATLPAAEHADTGERDRTGELRLRHGWAWLRPFRRYDDYAEAVASLEHQDVSVTERSTVS
jgi:hypothetical protein